MLSNLAQKKNIKCFNPIRDRLALVIMYVIYESLHLFHPIRLSLEIMSFVNIIIHLN